MSPEKNHVMDKGDIIRVFNDPHFCKNFEGKAELLEFLNIKGLLQEYWEVKFLSDGFVADRWINTITN